MPRERGNGESDVAALTYQNKRVTWKIRHYGWDGLRISRIGVHKTRYLFSITSSQIYNKEKLRQVKAILFNKFAMDSDTFLFKTVKPKIGHKLRACMFKY